MLIDVASQFLMIGTLIGIVIGIIFTHLYYKAKKCINCETEEPTFTPRR